LDADPAAHRVNIPRRSTIKALLRKAAERTVDGLWSAIGRLVDIFTPQECANYFSAAGYDAD
jgi:hypothetical protein